MKLESYLNQEQSAADLSKKIGVSTVQLSHWKVGFRPVPISHCAEIESATNGAVMRWDLRPNDWHKIWPELTKRKDAPKPISRSE